MHARGSSIFLDANFRGPATEVALEATFGEALGDALDTETVDEVGELQIFKQWATRNPNWACRLLGIKVKTSRGWGVFLRNEFGKFALSFPGDIVVVTNSGRHGVFKKLESVKKETYAGGKYPTSPSNMIRVSAPATALKSLQEILK